MRLHDGQDPDGEIENSGNFFFKSRIQNFCYIQVIVFDKWQWQRTCQVPTAATGRQLRSKNYNMNVTEVRDSDSKNAFPGIYNFTVGILINDKLFIIIFSFISSRYYIEIRDQTKSSDMMRLNSRKFEALNHGIEIQIISNIVKFLPLP